MNMQFVKKLAIPMELKEKFPLSMDLQEIVQKRDSELKNILSGKDNRLVLIIGPCSADNEDSVLDYCHRLKNVYDKVKDKLFIIPRIFTSKPRTNGKGYKGILHQPDPTGNEDMWNGIIKVRSLHMKVLKETLMNGADELLYTENYKYVDDIICYLSIGARSSENQEHRLTASGISIPVGIKNPTSGNLTVMMNSITAAQSQHTFIYRGWEVKSSGNSYSHVILRGYTNKHGSSLPNYHYEDLLFMKELYDKYDLQNKAVIVDCNHANSAKHPLEQIRIAKEVLHSCKYNNDIRKMIKGFMIESYIEDGSQSIGENVYGKSITDPCLGWDKTEKLIFEIADNL